MKRKDLKVGNMLTSKEKSKVKKYQDLIIGQTNLWSLLRYEFFILFCSWIPGALGLFLRNKLYPLFLGSMGKGVVFGNNVTIRHPHKIHIGDNVVIDDQCMLDAKGIRNNGIKIGNNVFIGRNTILSCKDGDISLEDGVIVGFNCEIYSANRVSIKSNAMLAAYTYLIGGGGYNLDFSDIPFTQQVNLDSKGILEIGSGVWVGANVIVMDGVTIGSGAVVGAKALVREDVQAYSIVAGIPAKVIGERSKSTTSA